MSERRILESATSRALSTAFQRHLNRFRRKFGESTQVTFDVVLESEEHVECIKLRPSMSIAPAGRPWMPAVTRRGGLASDA